MKNLFNAADKQEIIKRINALNVNSKGQWGTMTVAQMFKHNTLPMKMALTNPKMKRNLISRIMGPLIKTAVIGAKPFKKNGFTPKEFKVDTREVFDTQKTALLDLVNQFIPSNVSDKNHPFFGPLTEAEWGQSQYKHLDHHLTQFGV